MKNNEQIPNQVTTEPQRKALESMSEALVHKLNMMVAEQEARAREFANQQHSLSSLPTQHQPQLQTNIPKPYNNKQQAAYTPPPSKQQPEFPRYSTTQHAEAPREPQFSPTQHKDHRPTGRNNLRLFVKKKTNRRKESAPLPSLSSFLFFFLSFPELVHKNIFTLNIT